MSKPNWDFKQLNSNYRRWRDLIHETENHDHQCQCNLCIEEFGLGHNLGHFTPDEHMEAVRLEREIVDNCTFEGETDCVICGYPKKWHALKQREIVYPDGVREIIEPVLESEFNRI